MNSISIHCNYAKEENIKKPKLAYNFPEESCSEGYCDAGEFNYN